MIARRRILKLSAIVLASIAPWAAAAQALEVPHNGTFMGLREANGMTFEIETYRNALIGTFSQVNGDVSEVSLKLDEPNLAVGLIQIGSTFVVLTVEAIDATRIAIGTVPLDSEAQPVVEAARGFEFVRQ